MNKENNQKDISNNASGIGPHPTINIVDKASNKISFLAICISIVSIVMSFVFFIIQNNKWDVLNSGKIIMSNINTVKFKEIDKQGLIKLMNTDKFVIFLPLFINNIATGTYCLPYQLVLFDYKKKGQVFNSLPFNSESDAVQEKNRLNILETKENNENIEINKHFMFAIELKNAGNTFVKYLDIYDVKMVDFITKEFRSIFKSQYKIDLSPSSIYLLSINYYGPIDYDYEDFVFTIFYRYEDYRGLPVEDRIPIEYNIKKNTWVTWPQ